MRFLRVIAVLVCALAVAAPALAGGGGGGDKKKAKGPQKDRPFTSLKSWVMVSGFTVSIVQDGRVRGKFMVSFGMDVPDAALQEKAEALMPRLRDAWLSELNLYAATSLRPRRPADVARVSDMLQRAADTVLGQPGSKVLMGSATVAITN